MNVCVDTILFCSWTTVAFSATSEVGRVRCVGPLGVSQERGFARAPKPGDVWRVEGEWQEYAGTRQLAVCSASLCKPSGRLMVDYLTRHHAFRGIGVGVATATKLWETFGTELSHVLAAEDTARLAEVVGRDRALSLREAWLDLGLELATAEWMQAQGLDLVWAEKLRRVYGNQARSVVESNAYVLIALSDWSKVDRLARERFGIPADDTRRLVAAVEASIYEDVDGTGSTLMERATLCARVAEKLPRNVSADAAIDRALDAGAVEISPKGVRAIGPALMERAVEEWCNAALNHSAPLLSSQSDRWIELVKESERAAGVELNTEQREALRLGLTYSLSLVIGGAGVGKTTVLRTLAHALRATGESACFLAVAGRAARRIAEALGPLSEVFPCRTLASFIAQDPLEKDCSPLIVIDESSMIDLSQFYRLTRSLPRGARVMLVGDAAQLPPVGPGLVFHRLLEVSSVPRIELTTLYRQAASTGIPQVVAQLRKGSAPRLRTGLCENGVSFVPASNDQLVATCLEIRKQMLTQGDVMVLGVHKRTVNEINSTLAPSPSFQAGVPVIYRANDKGLGLSNGSLGVVVERDDQKLVVSWDDGVTRELVGVQLAYVGLAYALTVHKAQGSQWPQVLVLAEDSRLADRALIYTAATRAQQRVVIVGDRRAFQAAVEREPSVSKRRVGLFS